MAGGGEQGSAVSRLANATGRGFGFLMKLVLPAVILGGAVIGLQAMRDEEEGGRSFERREQATPVTTQPVVFQDVAPEIELFGELVASRTVELRAPVPGEVIEVHPALVSGGIVPAGETLLAIDPFDYEGAVVQARANRDEGRARIREVESRIALETTLSERAEEQLAVVQEDMARFEELLRRGSATQAQVDTKRLELSTRSQAVDQRRANVEIETARLEQTRAQVERLDWLLEVSERDLSRTALQAPVNAVVREANAEVGKLLNANDIVAVLYDPQSLEVRFALPDALYGRLLSQGDIIGHPVSISWRLGRDVRFAEGEIVRVGADIAAERGGVDVFAKVRDADPSLRPGAFLEVAVPDMTYEDVLLVPEAALYDGRKIYTVADERLVGHEVTVVASVEEGFLVSTDVETGVPLMTSRMTEAGNGVLVRDVNAPAAPEDESERGEPTREGVDQVSEGRPNGGRPRGEGRPEPGDRAGANARESR